jgi:hypothetical protein
VRFKIEGDLLFLAFVCQDRSNEQDKTVWWNTIVQLQPLLGTGYRGQYGQPVDPGLDVRRGTIFLCKHGGDTGDLILGIKDGSISNRRLVSTTNMFFVHTFGGTMRLIMEVPALERRQYQRVAVNEIPVTMNDTLWRHLGF